MKTDCVKMNRVLVLILSTFITFSSSADINPPPHIIFIYADDLGWNDVSFHGSPEIPTPNIDALAMNGILLNNYYGEYMCTPSRAALLSGKYPMRLGLQHFIIKAGEASALPIEEVTLPQHLKSLGYATHMIGKWHLGYMKKEYTPTFRGFDSFFGYYNGAIDYYDYSSEVITQLPNVPKFQGLDFWNGTHVVKDLHGKYATQEFTRKAKDIILNHDTSKPMFLYLSHLAVHSGNPYNPLQAPAEIIRKFKYIKDVKRRIQAAMTSALDDSVGDVMEALYQRDMLRNSIVVFASDNGGQIKGIMGAYSSNYPLRGKKKTFWEGGIHVSALVWSPLLKLKEPRVSDQLMHVTDWLPTFFYAAKGDLAVLKDIDGVNMWRAFAENSPSPRQELIHGPDLIYGMSTLRRGNWKLINGSSPEGYDEWYGPTGREYINQPNSMEKWVFSRENTVRRLLKDNNMWIVGDVDEWYEKSKIECPKTDNSGIKQCPLSKQPRLFNIKEDPCERVDLASYQPEMVNSMLQTIMMYQSVAATPQSKVSDSRANPMCYGYVHVPWLDQEYSAQYEICDGYE